MTLTPSERATIAAAEAIKREALRMSEFYSDDYDDFGDDLEDDEDLAELNCGSRRKRQCDLAGTEYCDWSCPLRDEVFPPKRRRRA